MAELYFLGGRHLRHLVLDPHYNRRAGREIVRHYAHRPVARRRATVQYRAHGWLGFVGKKSLPIDSPASAKLQKAPDAADAQPPAAAGAPARGTAADPVKAATGDQVTITMSGLSPVEDPNAFIWVRFGSGKGILHPLAIHNREATVQATVPVPPQPVPGQPVDVNVTTAMGIVLTAGKFTWKD